MENKNILFAIIALIVLILGGVILSLGLRGKLQPAISPLAKETPAVTQPAEPTKEIDTSNWETYRNEKYGFEIRYPKEYEMSEVCKLKETDNGIELGDGRFRIEIEMLKYEHPLENYVTKFVAEKMQALGMLGISLDELAERNLWIRQEEVVIDNNQGLKVEFPGSRPSSIIFLSKGNKFYKISWGALGVLGCLESEKLGGYDELEIFEQIPSTFKFIK